MLGGICPAAQRSVGKGARQHVQAGFILDGDIVHKKESLDVALRCHERVLVIFLQTDWNSGILPVVQISANGTPRRGDLSLILCQDEHREISIGITVSNNAGHGEENGVVETQTLLRLGTFLHWADHSGNVRTIASTVSVGYVACETRSKGFVDQFNERVLMDLQVHHMVQTCLIR